MRLRPPPPPAADPLETLLSQPAYEAVPIAIVPHCQAVPLGVLVRGLLEWLLDETALEKLFHDQAPDHYTRELTLSTLVHLMIQVSAGSRKSIFAAYKADQNSAAPTLSASFQALYGKLGRIPPAVSEALVRYSAEKLQVLVEDLPAPSVHELPGYRLRILDGNVLAGCDHRLKVLRQWLNTCLPGKSLVVYEPQLKLVTDLVLCEDAYTQERVLLREMLPRVRPGDLWLADRNFCTSRFVFAMRKQRGRFLVRQHRSNLAWKALGKLQRCGQTETGTVSEQLVRVFDRENGRKRVLRRIVVRLFEKTRNGERTLALLTNLPAKVTALELAELYRQRWKIENQFQFLTESLHCELKALGKPRASLFAFAMALVASNALAVVRANLRQAHGVEQEAEISGYYLADEMAADYRTVMKYLPADQWRGWQALDAQALTVLLSAIARHLNVKALERSPRKPKKPPKEKPVYNRKHTHFSIARLLQEPKDTC